MRRISDYVSALKLEHLHHGSEVVYKIFIFVFNFAYVGEKWTMRSISGPKIKVD